MGSRQDYAAHEPAEQMESQPPPFDSDTQEIRHELSSERVSLQRVLLDAYEFNGLAELGKSVFLFIVGLLFLYWQWGTTAAQFKNSMINNLATWDYGTDWQASDLQKVDSISKGAYYSLGLLQSMMYKTSVLNINDAVRSHVDDDDIHQFEMRGNSTLWVTEFSQINYARMTADLEGNCQFKANVIAYAQHSQHKQRKLECYRDVCDLSSTPYRCTDPDLALFLKRWQKITHRSKHKGKYALTLFTTADNYTVYDYVTGKQQPVATVSQSSGLLSDMLYGSVPDKTETPLGQTCTSEHAEVAYPPPCYFAPKEDVASLAKASQLPGPVDRRVLGKYASELKLGIVASDRLSSQEDAAMFTLTIALRGTFSPRLFRLSSTSTIKTDLNTAALRILDFLYIFFMIWFLRAEVARWRLCDKQSKSTALYFMYWWNWLQILSWISNLGFLIWGWSLKEVPNTIPLNLEDYDQLEYLADTYTAWLMFGAFMVFLLGVSVCRFMRIHLGLKAFYGVFLDAGRMMLDFAVFVLYIMLLLGAIVFAFFQISGGNMVFADFTDGISAMARLMFLYLSYDQFANYGLGLGQWYWTVTILFFLAAVLLVVFTFNVLLAIFITAYQNQRSKSLKVDFIFINLVGLRLWFLCFEVTRHYVAVLVCTCMGWKLPAEVQLPRCEHSNSQFRSSDRTQPPDSTAGMPSKRNFFVRLGHLVANYKVNSLGLHRTIFSQFQEQEEIVEHGRKLLWARWCVARLPETKALVGMYTNYATLKLQHVRWLEIDEAESGGRRTRETLENVEPVVPYGIMVPEQGPVSPGAEAGGPTWRWHRTAAREDGDQAPVSPGSSDQATLWNGQQKEAHVPRMKGEPLVQQSSEGLQTQVLGILHSWRRAASLGVRQLSSGAESNGSEQQPGGSGGAQKWRKDSLKGLGVALGSVVSSIRRSRFKRPKAPEVLPPVDAMLTRAQLRALLMFIATNAKRLSFRHFWMRCLLGSTPMDHLHASMVDQLVDTIFETYTYVPRLVREDEGKENDKESREEDAVRLMRRMERSWRSEREELEAQLDQMRRMLTDMLSAGQAGGQGTVGRELLARRPIGVRQPGRYWSNG